MMVSLTAMAALAALGAQDVGPVGAEMSSAADRQVDRIEAEAPAYFAQPVCPGVGGLSPEMGVAVLSEVRSLLAESGVELGADGACAPNLFIVVTPDSSEAIRELRRSQPTIFNRMSGPDFRALVSRPGPARYFRSSILRGADGRNLQQGGTHILPQSGSRSTDQLNTTANSRILPSTRLDVEQSFVYLDAAALRGLTLRQIAHYAAMVGTLPVSPSRIANLEQPSILSLFAGSGEAPAEATAADRAMLAAKY